MNNKIPYIDFVKNKGIQLPEKQSIPEENIFYHDMLFPHQRDIIKWSIAGMTRAIFASFGLGKTIIQLTIAQNVINHTGKPFLFPSHDH